MISPTEWLMAVTRTCITGLQDIQQAPVNRLAARAGRQAKANLADLLAAQAARRAAVLPATAIARLPDLLVIPEFGAILHHLAGRTVLYAPASQVTRHGAAALSAVAVRAGIVAPPGRPATVKAVTVTPVPHDDLIRDGKHPAEARVRDGVVTLRICSDLIAADLAEVIGEAWTWLATLTAAGDERAGT